jgi:hypothetical protein
MHSLALAEAGTFYILKISPAMGRRTADYLSRPFWVIGEGNHSRKEMTLGLKALTSPVRQSGFCFVRFFERRVERCCLCESLARRFFFGRSGFISPTTLRSENRPSLEGGN